MPSQVVFTTQPSSAAAGDTIAPTVQVSVEDSSGNVVTTDDSSVTVAIGANPSDGTLGGTLTVVAVDGVAMFSNLSIDKAGAGYTLTAADGSLTGATSAGFNVTLPSNLGVFSGGYWYRDMIGNGVWGSGDGSPIALGWAGATPVAGDWDGSGKTEIGVYNDGTWWLDTTSGVETFTFGFPSSPGNLVIPVVGDWNGDGKTEVGVYCNGAWFRDVDGTHTWDATNQAALAYLGWNDGGTGSVVPVPGYWAGDGKTEMGVYCNGVWFLDSTGSGKYDGTYSYWGWYSPNSPLVPVAGDWGGTGTKDQFAVYNQGVWFRDVDGTHQWDATNQAAVAYFGWAGAQPVVGDWLNYASAAQGASLPAAAVAAALPPAGAVASQVGAAIQSPFTADTSSGSGAAQEQESLLAPVPGAGRSGPIGSSSRGDEAIAADHDHEYIVPDTVPAQTMGPAAIDPQAVDRIDLAAAVKTALGPRVRLTI